MRISVKTRLASGSGMSFGEFSYPILQAWDWWTLFKHGCQVQVGGSDQYGNILFGMDAVKTISRNTVMQEDHNNLENDLDRPYGITTPLLTTSSGEKFGKSAGNAIWLDKDITNPFLLYQVSRSRLYLGNDADFDSFSFAFPTMLSSVT